MSGIQILLIVGVILLTLYYMLRLRNALLDLLLFILFAGTAIFFILAPQYTNNIAHRLGVGRGADLLFYICILFFLYVILKMFARIRRLEKSLTELVRQQAQKEARTINEMTDAV